MSSEAVIVKIDLSISPDEFIRRHLGRQSDETKRNIDQVIAEKKLIDKAKNSVDEKTRLITEEIDSVFNHLCAQGETGLLKSEVISRLVKIGAVKSSSGATLKLKSLVATNMVGFELKTTKDRYFITKSSISVD